MHILMLIWSYICSGECLEPKTEKYTGPNHKCKVKRMAYQLTAVLVTQIVENFGFVCGTAINQLNQSN